MTGRYGRREALSVGRQDAGVGDQTVPCPYGDEACARGDAPCFDCLLEGVA